MHPELRSWWGVVATLAAVTGIGCNNAAMTPDAPPPDPVELSSALDRATVTTGQVVTWTVEVERAPEIEVAFDDPGAKIGGLAVVDLRREEETLRSGRKRDRRIYRLRPDLAGSYVVPEVTVRWRRQVAEGSDPEPWSESSASRLFLEAEPLGVVSAEDGGDIRDIKPIEPRPRLPWAKIAIATAGFVALIAVVWWLLRRRARRRFAAPTAPPWEVAWARLEALRSLDLDDAVVLRTFHFELSEILRAYVEGRFGLNATDLTTEEILGRLAETEGPAVVLTGEPREALLRSLAATDRVKFARHEPVSEEVQQAWNDALLVVEATRPSEGELSARPTTEEVAA